MQVISSRFSLTASSSSTERTPRKGLSLTSKDKSNSLPKHTNPILTSELSQSYHHLNHKHQLPFKEDTASLSFRQPPSYISNQPSHVFSQTSSFISSQPSSFICSQFSPYIPSQPSIPIETPITEMPKITFHYTTQPATKIVNF